VTRKNFTLFNIPSAAQSRGPKQFLLTFKKEILEISGLAPKANHLHPATIPDRVRHKLVRNVPGKVTLNGSAAQTKSQQNRSICDEKYF